MQDLEAKTKLGGWPVQRVPESLLKILAKIPGSLGTVATSWPQLQLLWNRRSSDDLALCAPPLYHCALRWANLLDTSTHQTKCFQGASLVGVCGPPLYPYHYHCCCPGHQQQPGCPEVAAALDARVHHGQLGLCDV